MSTSEAVMSIIQSWEILEEEGEMLSGTRRVLLDMLSAIHSGDCDLDLPNYEDEDDES